MNKQRKHIHSVLPYFKYFLTLFFIFLLLSHPALSIDGAKKGLLLWYKTVLPTLLPFFILIDYFISNGGLKVKKQRFTGEKNPFFSYLPTIFLGLLCGFPMGGKLINNLIKNDKLTNPIIIHCLLAISNNASPMFIIGYLYHGYLSTICSLPFLIFCLYTPHMILLLFLYLFTLIAKSSSTSCKKKEPQRQQPYGSLNTSIASSFTLICNIGIYIMIYSILANYLTLLPISSLWQAGATGCLEITTGIHKLANASILSMGIVGALLTGITSFGGLSAASQTACAMEDANTSMYPYILIKLIFGILSGSLFFLFV